MLVHARTTTASSPPIGRFTDRHGDRRHRSRALPAVAALVLIAAGFCGVATPAGAADATVPGAPTSVTATAAFASAAVDFVTPGDDGGSPITGYTVTAADTTTPANGGQIATGTVGPITVTGLTGGDAYTFSVTATNAIGTGAASAGSAPVTIKTPTVPDAPQNVQLDGLGVHSILVSYEPPGSDGGSPITSYTATAIDVTNSANGGQTATGTDQPLEVHGLTFGDTYEFIVTATNAVGTGPAGGPTGLAVSEPIAPDPPTDVTAVAGAASATVSFTPTPPSGDGGAPIVSYTVSSWYIDNHMVLDGPGATGTSSPITVTGLTNGVSYTFHVAAFNGSQTGYASPWTNEVTPQDVPGAPTDVTATAGHESATVSFDAPDDDGGLPISAYTVTETDTTHPADSGRSVTGSTSPVVFGALTAGDAYTFVVTATNSLGIGSASPATTPVVPTAIVAPNPPTNVTADPGHRAATVSFAAPADDGGAPITNYTVTATDLTDAANGGQTVTGATGPITVTGLTAGDRYTFSVAATNAIGVGAASTASAPVTPLAAVPPPDFPTYVHATPGGASASVSFSTPADDGGSPITGYIVTTTDHTDPANGGQQATGPASAITVAGLTPGDEYTFTVTAVNAVGTGPESGASNEISPFTTDAPGAPTDVVATGGIAEAMVTWTAPTDNGGMPITGYTVTVTDTTDPSVDDQTISADASQTGVLALGLINGDTYVFTVTATNDSGVGPASEPSAPVTPATYPGTPTDVTAVAGSGQATVSFAVPTDDGGASITSYTVTATDTTNGANGGQTATGTTGPITVTGLTDGDSYTFTVAATNRVTTGFDSESSDPIVPSAVALPGPPTDVSAVAVHGQATVSFTAPANDGGSSITGYTVTATDVTDPANGGQTALGAAGPITVEGLTNGDTYTFVVDATNAVGIGPASGVSAPVVVPAATAPDAPRNVAIYSVDGHSVTVAFDAPDADGGSPITSYTVTAVDLSDPVVGDRGAVGVAGPITVDGLVFGDEYEFEVAATNAVGTGPVGGPTGIVLVEPAAPNPPTGVTAVAGPGSATVSFTPTPSSGDGGAPITGYTVQSWYVANHVMTAGPTATGASSPITVTGLTNGVSYYFQVTASNGTANSIPSDPSGSVTPQAPPGPPGDVTVTPGHGSATVSFVAPVDDGGSSITGYTVTATDVTDSANGGQRATGAVGPITVDGLTAGDSYTFTVTATNALGDGNSSPASGSVVPLAVVVPGAPTDVVATPGGNSSTVSFVAPVDDGGSPITGYTVTATDVTDSANGHQTATGAVGPITVDGLTAGDSYTFTVTATNALGDGPASSASAPVVPIGVDAPDAPTGVTVEAAVDGRAVVVWNAPAHDGGSPITGSIVTATDVTDPADGGQKATVVGEDTGATVFGLTVGDTYTFTVVATNASRTSAASSPSASVVVVTEPGAPTNVAAVAGDASATVTFTPPTDDGFAPITNYGVMATDVTNSANGGQTVTGGTSPIVVTGLTNGDTYTFAVVAVNGAGLPGQSSADSAPIIAGTPGAPSDVSAVAGDGSATVSFAAPTDDGGSPITGYVVTAHDATDPAHGDRHATGTTSPIVVSGLTDGDSYTFTVVASNSVGSGAVSAPSEPVTPTAPVTVPGAPSGVSVVAGDASAVVSFSAPAGDGGSPVTGYTVTAQDTTDPGNADVSVSGSSSPITVTGLVNGDTYTFTVVASNSAGSGAVSAPSGPVTPVAPVTVPGAPSGVSVTAGDGSATVSFAAPPDDGGSPITGYTVTAHDTTNPGNADVQATGSSSPITVNGLVNGDTYTFTVVATNSAGSGAVSAPSGSVSPSAPVTVPGAPSIVSVTAGDASATVTFSAPSDDGGSPIMGYTVTAHDTTDPGNADVQATGSSSPITVTGLVNGDTYTFTVVATNSAGSGAVSAPSGSDAPSSPVTVPGAPSGVAVVAGDGSVTVTFSAPSDDGGSPVTGYTVTAHDTTDPRNADVQATGSSSPITVTGLVNGDTYTFTVVATNSAGSGDPSPSSGSVSPSAPSGPSTPTAPSTPVTPSNPSAPSTPLSPTAAFVTAVYDDFVGRVPTEDELASGVAALAGGASHASVVARVASTQAWADHVVTELYTAILGRRPDAAGLGYWADLLISGRSDVPAVARQILASHECFAAAGSTEAWINALYRVLLNRSPSASSLDYWKAVAVARGRGAVVYAIQQSEEARRDVVAALYEALLQRDPDARGLDYWAGRLRVEGVDDVARQIAASAEFFRNAQVSAT